MWKNQNYDQVQEAQRKNVFHHHISPRQTFNMPEIITVTFKSHILLPQVNEFTHPSITPPC